MRLTKEQAEQNRRTIVETASRLFRARGIENVSVADVMKESGFTHGGFYNHFASKEELAAEAVACAFDTATRNFAETVSSGSDPRKALLSALAAYLSPEHRDECAEGCPATALQADVARTGANIQQIYAAGIETYLDILAAPIGGDKRKSRQEAMSAISAMVGALSLSRAVKDGQPELSDELLSVARKHFRRLIAELIPKRKPAPSGADH
jgi:TetR/AcrR family transcriptional regulator, transcriptional repressor for nem operon